MQLKHRFYKKNKKKWKIYFFIEIFFVSLHRISKIASYMKGDDLEFTDDLPEISRVENAKDAQVINMIQGCNRLELQP